MSDPFARALAALHQSAVSVPATYTPKAGQAFPIRVIWSQGSQAATGQGSSRVADTNTFDVQRTDVLMPKRGDRISDVVDPATGALLTFVVNGAPILDTEGVSWSCPVEPA